MSAQLLVDIPGGKRELEATRRFLDVTAHAPAGLELAFFKSLGLACPEFAWYLLQLDMSRLTNALQGDIDILAGSLSWQRTRSAAGGPGGLAWPPPIRALGGVEVKASLVPRHLLKDVLAAQDVKSQKASPSQVRKARLQLGKLAALGLDHIALLDVICVPEAYGNQGLAWFEAMHRTGGAWDAVGPTYKGRLPDGAVAGHWAWLMGPVGGEGEDRRGVSSVVRVRTSCKRVGRGGPVASTRRQEVEGNLTAILQSLSRPTTLPAVYVDCRDCGQIHVAGATCHSANTREKTEKKRGYDARCERERQTQRRSVTMRAVRSEGWGHANPLQGNDAGPARRGGQASVPPSGGQSGLGDSPGATAWAR
jgi:hypothetical protein